jgi:DNA-binding CsgD family transcriptional regulator
LFALTHDLAATTGQLIETTGAKSYAELADTAIAAAYLASGRPAESIPLLRDARRRLLAGGAIEHSLFIPTFGDYIEALIRTGHLAEAAAEVAEELPRAEAGALAASLAVTYRCRAQVAHGREAVAWYDRALRAHATSPDAFQAARTHLAYGRALREAGDTEAASEQLEQAVEMFTALGSDPWCEAADQELDLLILPPEGGGVRLTAQERRVMRLAAGGATDEQISEALGITPWSVDHDLRRLYSKLGVSRTTTSAPRI